jgi:hypothetical protein
MSQIALAIKILLDTSDLSLEEVTDRLKVTEDRLESPKPLREQGKLLLTEGQWLEKMIALAIKILLDTSDLSLEEVTDRLKVTEDHLESPKPPREQGKLLLTEEQWLEKMKGGQGGSSSRPARGSGQRRRRPPRKKGGAGGNNHAKVRDSLRDDTCRNCGRSGAKGCWQPRRNRAYLARRRSAPLLPQP